MADSPGIRYQPPARSNPSSAGLVIRLLIFLGGIAFIVVQIVVFARQQGQVKVQNTFNSGRNNLQRALSFQESGKGDMAKAYFGLAFTDFTHAIEAKPDFSEAYDHRGLVYQALGNYNAAIADGSQAIVYAPDSYRAYNNRGTSYHASGDTDRALADYSKAIELNPKFGKAYFNRGLILFYQGNFKQAIPDFTQAIAYSLSLPGGSSSFARDRQLLGDSIYNSIALDAVEADAPLAAAYRGMAYAADGMEPEALADFAQAITLRPDLSLAYYNRGLVYLLTGETGQAILDFQKVLALNNDSISQAAAQEKLDLLGAPAASQP